MAEASSPGNAQEPLPGGENAPRPAEDSTAAPGPPYPDPVDAEWSAPPRVEAAWQTYVQLARHELGRLADRAGRYPHYCDAGRWRWLPLDAPSGWQPDGYYEHGNWTAGLTVGQAWLVGLDDGASSRTDGSLTGGLLADVATRREDTTTCDLGMLFYPAFALGDVTGQLEAHARQPALEAASTLGARFDRRGGYFPAVGMLDDHEHPRISTIDTLMMMPLLYWAAGHVAGTDWTEEALRHALFSAEVFVRADGSTHHIAKLDRETSEPVGFGTMQGAGAGSCWTRGQAWAIAGFAWAYGVHRDARLLAAAESAWHYFAERVPADGVVPWDFGDVGDDPIPDASASAVAAFGALLLGGTHPDPEARRAYRVAAWSLLERLAVNAVAVEPGTDGILHRSCYSRPQGLGVGGAIPAGDYFYGLALAVATGRVGVHTLVGQSSRVS